MILRTTGNGLALMVSREEATGSTKLWPGRPASIAEAEIAAQLDRVREALETDTWTAQRHIEVRSGRARRGWSWRRAIGPLVQVDWLDEMPAPVAEVSARPWPRTPAPTSAADRAVRRAA